ncbi:MAG: hypothetical protein K2M91_01720, partial [Lachnospiraceae bacterium]|nr:hypothetical protein [Lachnospiraceae bacterium]
ECITARIFEYDNIVWTRSADDATAIKAVVKEHFGFITPMVAKELLANGSHWHTKFVSWQTRIRQRIADDGYSLGIADRVTDVMALYMVSCEILNEILGLEFNVEKVYDFFYRYIVFKNAEEENRGRSAYNAVMNHFIRYQDRYQDAEVSMLLSADDKVNYMMPPEIEGLIETAPRLHRDRKGNTYNRYIIFNVGVLEKILMDNGYPEPKVTLRRMLDEGLLRTKGNDRTCINVRFNGVDTLTCAVYFNDTKYGAPKETDN